MASRSRLPGVLALVTTLVLCLAAAACGDKPSKKDCEALLDKVIDLEIAAAGTDKLPEDMKADLKKHREQLKDYLQEAFMKQCMDNTPAAVIKCGLAAGSMDEYAACDAR